MNKFVANSITIFNNIDEIALSQNISGEVTTIITKSAREASELNKLLASVLSPVSIFYFPDWETLAYDHYSPSANIIAERLNTLYKIRNIRQGLIITSIDAILTRLCPVSYLDSHAFIIKTGDELPLSTLTKRLSKAGFIKVNKVSERGQFSQRGALLDLFPPSSKFPIRLDYFADEIESIRIFDLKTQLTIKKITSIDLIPNREVDLSTTGYTCFRQSMRQLWGSSKSENHAVYKRLTDDNLLGGLEYYLPLFFDETVSFFAYLPDRNNIKIERGYKSYIKNKLQEIKNRYLNIIAMGGEREPLPPEIIYFRYNEWINFLPQKHDDIDIDIKLSRLKIDGSSKQRWQYLQKILQGKTASYLFCNSYGQKKYLIEKLNYDYPELDFNDWDAKQHAIGVGYFPRSYKVQSIPKRYLLSATEFLLQVNTSNTEVSEKSIDKASIIDDLSQLEVNMPVVHNEHGVGRYQGLELIETNGELNEYITILYACGGKIFIPVTSLDMITRYSAIGLKNIPAHRLDGKQWEKTKAKARAKIHDIAVDLLEIYAKRLRAVGKSVAIDRDELANFTEGFPFIETTDQRKTFNNVYNDLQMQRPMDRVVCGDVGFGKTEVALRAAFVVASAGQQVAILVPTTLLSEQHLKNFSDRFSSFPINISGLSRFKTAKEQKTILTEVKNGVIDIIIGTHRLLQKDVQFKNLGLVIIDEEHKFGVKQKENLKKIRIDVNILTLTATPIPRTLSMSLSGLRDLSIIASPPPKRMPIETIFIDFNEDIIIEGVERERYRGGQVYFLHNDVSTMMNMKTRLQKLFPKLAIRHAHGQMREKELEHIMLDFYQQNFDLLLTTTIVESGIDNPNVNTIFINRADKFGIAQLHQLRGRVGRSYHQAYAYLITPGKKIISSKAKKRLAAFASLKDLGVGFMLASQDMEIRGVGELLGDNQSGQITEIGFSLFNSMLEETIDAIKNNREIDFDSKHSEIDIDIGVPALIPKSYVYDVHDRLLLYKRISGCSCDDDFNKLQIEFIDRFGLLPSAVKALFAIFEIKLLARNIGVHKVVASDNEINLILLKNHNLDGEKLITLIQQKAKQYKLARNSKNQDKIIILHTSKDWQERVLFIKNWLEEFLIK